MLPVYSAGVEVQSHCMRQPAHCSVWNKLLWKHSRNHVFQL